MNDFKATHLMPDELNPDFNWLLSSAAPPILELAQADFADQINPVRIAKRLRKLVTPTQAAMVMEQAQLRSRGKIKFPTAEKFFFTRRGLEQATSYSLALYKARRFDGIEQVVDICCGIGGDLIGLAGRQLAIKTVGVDADPLTARFAQANLEQFSIQQAASGSPLSGTTEIRCQEFSTCDLQDFAGIHCDPDRRVGDRTVIGSRFSPSLNEIFRRVTLQQNLVIKVAPATPTPRELPEGTEREWIGDRRECKQQLLCRGPAFDRPEHRTATLVDGDEVQQLSVPEDEIDITIETCRQIRRYLYEPHPTVLAAGLTNIVANRGGLARFDPDIDYLTSHDPKRHALLTRFEVVEAFPLNQKKGRDFLLAHQIGLLEVKNRGAAKIHFDYFQRLKLSGPFRATVVLTRIGLQQWVLICRRNVTDFPF